MFPVNKIQNSFFTIVHMHSVAVFIREKTGGLITLEHMIRKTHHENST